MNGVQGNTLEAPMCETVLQMLDMGAPKPTFERARIIFCWQAEWVMLGYLLKPERIFEFQTS